MMNIPGLKADIGFGGVNKALPDWRKSKTIASEIDPDDEQIETPADVVAVLGFDPAKDETMTMTQPKSGLHTALVKRMKGAKNASQLAMFSPSPCISAYGAGKQQRIARNRGTSEGAVKGWQKRANHLGWDILHRTVPTRFGVLHQAKVHTDEPSTAEPKAFKTESEALSHAKRNAEFFGPRKDWTANGTQQGLIHRKREGDEHIGSMFGLTKKQSHAEGTSARVYSHWKKTGFGFKRVQKLGAMTGASNTDPAAQADTLRERLVRRLAKSKRPKPLPGQKPALTGHGWSQQNWWEAKGGTKV